MDLFFNILETFLPLIFIFIFFIKKSKRSTWTKLLLYYSIAYFLLSAYGNILYNAFPHLSFLHGGNVVIYIVIAALTFVFFSLVLEQFLGKQKFKNLNRTVVSITLLFIIMNARWGEGTSAFNSYSSGLSNLILILYCVYYYKLQLEKLEAIFVEKLPSFWIVSGIFIYSAGNFFLFIMFNTLTRNYPELAFYAWGINIFLLLIMNIFFAKGVHATW
jgi:hypothetical protein